MPKLLGLVLLAAAYTAVAWLGTSIASLPPARLTAIAFASGIGLILFRAAGRRAFAWVAAAGALANLPACVVAAGGRSPWIPVAVAAAYGCVDAVQAWLAWRATLALEARLGRPLFRGGRDVLSFGLQACLLPSAVTAWPMVLLPVALVREAPSLATLAERAGLVTAGDALGLLAVAPIAWAFGRDARDRDRDCGGGATHALRRGFAGAAFLAIPGLAAHVWRHEAEYLVFVFAVVAAMRLGFAGTSIALACYALVATVASSAGFGPYVGTGATGTYAHLVFSLGTLVVVGQYAALAWDELQCEKRTLDRRVAERTAEIEAASALVRETEERFRSLVDSAPDAIFVQVGPCFAYVNAAAQALFRAESAASLVGTPVLDRVHANFRDAVRERMRTTLVARLAVPPAEHDYVRLDGTPVPVEVSAVPVIWKGGTAALVFARDVSERRRLQEHLVQTQKMESVGRLAGGVAHEFNNKLAVILGYADIAADQAAPGSELRRHLDEIRTAAKRSAELTQQLLEFARRRPDEPRVLRLDEHVRSRADVLRRMLPEEVALRVDCAQDCGHVRIDPVNLDHALMILVENARDAITGPGEVEIAVARETRAAARTDVGAAAPPLGAGAPPHAAGAGEYVRLTVRDTGRGMDEATLSHAFEPFFTTRPFGEGTGLGLSILWGIVTRAGGFVDVRSAPGQGTTFSVHFPRVHAADVPRESVPAEPARRGHETILLVDDEDSVRRMAAAALRTAGYHVLEASGPAEAIEAFERHADEVRVLVTDVIMPLMDGRQLQQHLLALRPGLPTLFVSGYSADRISKHGVLEPGVAFLAKPFTIATLSAKVREVLDAADRAAAF